MDLLHKFLKTNNPTKAEKKILVGLLSILIILCTLTFLSHRNSKRVISSAEEVEHSQEIKYHIQEILSYSADLETGARGYIITGDASYLDPAHKAIASIYIHLDHLKELLGNDPKSVKRIQELSGLIEREISVSTVSVEIRKAKGLDEAIAYVANGKSKAVMDDIRAISDTMLKEEDVKLKREREENRTYIKNFNLTFDLMLVKIALSVLTVFFVLRFYFKKRRKDENLLRDHQKLLQSVIDNTSSVIFIKDLSGRYLLINNRFEQLFHITREEIKGKTDYNIFPKDVADHVRKADLEVVHSGKTMEFEEDVPNNGELRHYISIKFPLFDHDNIIYAVGGIATDITERKLTEKEIRLRADHIMDLFNNAPCAYHSVNAEGIITEINDTELKWLGYTRDEVVGKMNILDIFSEESKKTINKNFPRMKEGKIESLINLEMLLMRKDGSVFPVEAHITVLFDDEGKFLRTRTSLFDISMRRQADSLMSNN